MGLLSLDLGLMIWTLLTFGGLMLLLARFAFRPLRRMLEQREESIRESLARAARSREAAEELIVRGEKQLEEAREETRRVIAEGHKIVADMKREAQGAAREEADRIVGQARSDIDRELQRAMNELKGTVASLAVRISRQTLKEQLDESRHAALAEEFIEKLKHTHALPKS